MVFRLVDDLVADLKYNGWFSSCWRWSGLNVCMVMSYTFFRFATPYFALLCADRIEGRARSAMFMLAAGAVVMGTSPEVGITFAAGASFFICSARGAMDGTGWLPRRRHGAASRW